ncbi:hypothetical protein KVR01_001095 [Diaporthe batatas]|uniref:uncharacterized protein n=1 Tax=Diaporthe batatas TaxID=748121 RepID=UPI001D0414E0|nr:uncharacterized protein KVR01_001095 [Diaporthe batatas]KAG8168346.1 hypothetical protein KVR01_001095 [Diaporthe batatas]
MHQRASILDFKIDSVAGVETCELKRCNGLAQLEHYFEEHKKNAKISNERRLLIVETATNEFTFQGLKKQLTSELGVSEDIFQRHQWSQTTFRFNEVINCPRLPTTARPRTSFSLEYFELWHVDASCHAWFNRHNPATVRCGSTGRQIQCYHWMESRGNGWLLVAPRKCSFWSKQDGDGWKAVILCDPAPRTVRLNDDSDTLIDVKITAFEKGYHGFIPDEVRGSKLREPSHLSLLDDITYYFEHYVDVLGHLADPASAAIFPRKVVASHYCQLLGFVSHQTASMRSSGWAAQRRTVQEINESNQVETAWRQFKCPEYLEALGAVLDSLGIPQGHEPYEIFDTRSAVEVSSKYKARERPLDDDDWRSSVPDFLYLHREFRAHLADYARMTSSLAALNGMIGGRIAILEARTARSLTLVAMVFAPPACVASIFSIPFDMFGQDGGPRFWWYWVAAIPLTLVVFLLTYLVHERDGFFRLWETKKKAHGPEDMKDRMANGHHRSKELV